jgi:hypothetical protein
MVPNYSLQRTLGICSLQEHACKELKQVFDCHYNINFVVFSLQLIMFLKGFNEEERQKLGKIIGLCLANGLGNPACLSATFDDHLVKEGRCRRTLYRMPPCTIFFLKFNILIFTLLFEFYLKKMNNVILHT